MPVTRSTTRPQRAVLETTNGVETTAEVVLIEGQAGGRTIAIAITQFGVQAHGIGVVQRMEQLTAIIQLEERQVATRRGGFQHKALRVPAGSQHPFVQGRLGPTGRGLEVQETAALLINEIENFVNGEDTGLDGVLLRRHAEGKA